MATKTPVYNELTKQFTNAFVRGILIANYENDKIEDSTLRVQNAIAIAQAIATAGLVQPDLVNDKQLEALADQVRNRVNYKHTQKEEASAAVAPESKEPASKKEAMQKAVDKKIAEQEAAKEKEENPAQADIKPQPMEKTQAVAPAPAAEEPKAAGTAAVPAEDTSAYENERDWNDITLNKFANEIQFVNQLKEAFGEETCNMLMQQYSQGTYSSVDELVPANIKGFVAYVQQLQAAAQNGESQAS